MPALLFLLDQVHGVAAFVAVGRQHIHHGDDLAVGVHSHVHQITIEKVAVLTRAGIGIVHAQHLVSRLGIVAVRQDLIGQGQRRPQLLLGWFALLLEDLLPGHFVGPGEHAPQVGHTLHQTFFVLRVFAPQADGFGLLLFCGNALVGEGPKRSSNWSRTSATKRMVEGTAMLAMM